MVENNPKKPEQDTRVFWNLIVKAPKSERDMEFYFNQMKLKMFWGMERFASIPMSTSIKSFQGMANYIGSIGTKVRGKR